MIIKIIHDIIKHSLIFLSPFIIISLSVAVNLPDVNLHKKVLLENNFYQKVSNEVKAYSELVKSNQVARAANLESAINQSFIGYVLSDYSTPDWWQKIFESNLDNFKTWLNNDDFTGEKLRLLWPDQQFISSVNSNNDNIATFIKQNANENRACTDLELKQNINDLSKSQCYINNINSINTGATKNELFGGLSKVSPDSFGWFNLIKYLKFAFNLARYLAIPIAIIYTLAIIFVILTSYAANNNTKNTVVMILGRIGFSTLFASIGVFAVLYISTLMLQASSFLGSGVSINNLQQIIQTQLTMHTWAILSPAIYIAVGFIIFHYIVKFLPKF